MAPKDQQAKLEEERDLHLFNKESSKESRQKEKDLSLDRVQDLTMMTFIIILRVMKPKEEYPWLRIKNFKATYPLM
jgi:hypothetical protein